jgi:hypothetical protein
MTSKHNSLDDRKDLYGRKRKKNYTILACLFGFIALIWAITMVKMGLQ